jgi:hypothetical protein
MADRFYTQPAFGDDRISSVVEGAAATPGNPIDVRVTYDATNASKLRTIRFLENIIEYITRDAWPPV